MKNILPLSLLCTLLLSAVTGFSQNNFCGSDAMRKELIAKHPEILQSEKELEDFTKQFSPSLSGQRSGPYIIPMVFHIIHRGGTENITDAQVRDEMRILNEDYNKLNADTADVIAPFKNIIGNIGFEFRLATKDPNGNPTNGIEHIWGSQTYQGNDQCKLNPWPRDKYLNVWVFMKMRDGVAGYAYYPGSVDVVGESPMIDGINILSGYVGSLPPNSYFTARALTHEIGHYLNLKHVWGDTNEPGVSCGDDDVQDTPETKGWDHCPTPNQAAVCNPPVIENYQNFMEYSYCDKMFTEDQKTRMIAALNSTKAQRNNLWSPSNLVETGTDSNTPCVCTPICDFSVNKLFACVGEPVIYSDNSYNADVTSRLWTFPGGSIGDSFNPSATVSYDAPGVYPVTLSVTGANGTSTKTQSLVTVKDTISLGTPYYDNFDDAGDFNYWWSTNNVDRDEAKFQYCSTAGRNQSKSILLNTYMNHTDMNFDELVSPPYDCSTLNGTALRLSFYYSFATWEPSFNLYSATDNTADSIIVFAQKTCGGTWVKLYANGANNLFNAGYQDGYYTPGVDQIYWRKVDFAIPTAFKARGVRFKVVVISSHEANNFYLDDWNVGVTPTGLEEVAFDNINVMPNPFTSAVRLENLPDGDITCEVRDITGRLLSTQTLQQSDNTAEVDMSGINSAGMYLFTLRQKSSFKTFRLVKE